MTCCVTTNKLEKVNRSNYSFAELGHPITLKISPHSGEVICKAGFFTPLCDVFCNISSPFFDCDPVTGRRICKANRDNDTNCETCKKGWHGPLCNCTVSRMNSKECASDGRLVCKEGWAGQDCLECAENWYGRSNCTESSGGTRTCTIRCDTYCVDMTGLICNSEGVLELTPELAALWYPEEEYFELKCVAIVIGTIMGWILSTVILYRTFVAWNWFPAGVSK